VAWPVQKFWWVKMFDFRPATVFCLKYCLLTHKMTRYYKKFWRSMAPCPSWLRLCTCGLYNVYV